jgi:hypothetical protein
MRYGLQERRDIGLAIRREVGRRYRKLPQSGAKPQGSNKLWQQVRSSHWSIGSCWSTPTGHSPLLVYLGCPSYASQAFAQVMLLQQETIASLMGMLEEARAQAARTLAPLTRPPSPAKRRALEQEEEARARLQQDRCGLVSLEP